MKKILYMTGAVINAGDFLIEKRAKALISEFIPGVNITTENRVNIDYSDRIDYLNSFDAILFPGGPIYQTGIYPKAIPFVKDLDAISTPTFFLGGGGKTRVYGNLMTEQTKKFFSLGIKNGVPLGCRDWLTYRFLKQQGFSDVLMTGCPAWYSLSHINNTNINFHKNKKMKICVSEPARINNVQLLKALLHKLRERYNDAIIILVIHRENKKSIDTWLDQLKNDLDISCAYISGSVDGFQIYDDCDLHIGFRVHAHIYNLSIRNISVLINEDMRGVGVNHALGIENINIEDVIIRKRKLFGSYYLSKEVDRSSINYNVIQHIFDYLEYSDMVRYKNYIEAFTKMKERFSIMQSHIQSIKTVL